MKRIAVVSQKNCVSCGSCAQACPKHAIQMFHGLYAKVEQSLCIGCGLCQKVCPADIITMQEVIPLGEKEILV